MKNDLTHEFFLGFIKIHILHHAAEQPVYGLWLIEELSRHGYRLSPGTLYPLLHSLEKEKYLECQEKVIEGKIRKYYRTTAKGRKALNQAKDKIKELIEEVVS
ncbi:MAG: helix-turn-helix transcriptional regulator [Candidatus Saccharicenans sp.]|jgi:DNA-binding PadR family transcriptional regulator|nr:helix-turn-helix transcriptional regulator [Candidatus Saccharicenans sp.]